MRPSSPYVVRIETESVELQRQLRDRDTALLRLVFGGWALLGWLAVVILA